METGKRLVPYSVHLTEEVYLKLKEVAKHRKASSMVRDAITMILDGNDEFDSGYVKGIKDCVNVVKQNENAKSVTFHGDNLAEVLIDQMNLLAEIKNG